MTGTKEFKREERFIVIKRKHLSSAAEDDIRSYLGNNKITTVECVVIESDWPEYKTVWGMIEARCKGKPTQITLTETQSAGEQSFAENANEAAEQRIASPKSAAIAITSGQMTDAQTRLLTLLRSNPEGIQDDDPRLAEFYSEEITIGPIDLTVGAIEYAIFQGWVEEIPVGLTEYKQFRINDTGLAMLTNETLIITDNWKWYAGRDEEHFELGPFDCREDAVADGTDEFDEEDGFYIIEATKAAWSPPSADKIINDMFENSEDLFDDDCPEQQGTAEQGLAAEKELQAALNYWMDKWRNEIFPTPWTFGKTRNSEYIKILPLTPEMN